MRQRKFPVVALGASAGGLEALIDFFQSLPPKPGMAFLVAVHLAPEHESQLPLILSQHAKLPVLEAVDGALVARDRAYVIPPGKNLELSRGRLRLSARQEGRGPVDVLFRALARDQGSRAAGIVLSGEGSDGTRGLLELRAAGAVTIAQDEETAKHASMPASAVAAGAAEQVLPPRRMAEELPRLLRRDRETTRQKRARTPRTEKEALARICDLVSSAAGVDFTRYKQSTIVRRVTRHMGLRGFKTFRAYLGRLEGSPAEIGALHDDLLIHVTGFFRDPQAFKALEAKVYPELLKRRGAREPIRIWVAGCSTGEEAYSHAINLLEHLRQTKTQAQIQIFATDVDLGVLETARAGLYPDKIAKDVPADRLRRYFVKTKGGYRVQKFVRELCVFARQDLVKDPPFSSIDLLSCRNVLIYFGQALQRRAVPIMHYALRPGGFLMLGNSETVGDFSERFAMISRKANLYAKKPARLPLPEGVIARAKALEMPPAPSAFAAAIAPIERREAPLERQVERLLLERYAPPAVVVDDALNVVQTHGHTAPFLELPPGKVSVNLLRMIRPELAMSLRLAFSQAKRSGAPARKGPVTLAVEGRRAEVRLEAAPLKAEAGERHYLVIFRESASTAPASGRSRSSDSRELAQLRQEVGAARKYLRLTVEDQEAANQEIKSAHEEILSSNEELQSMNEELETAKEELQSTNEEMATVNEELTLRNRELKTANDDLANLLASSQIPILMLGTDLKIRKVTPPAEAALHLSSADVGRSISDVRLNIVAPFLEKELAAVARSGRTKEFEIQDRQGRWYAMWLRPNQAAEGRADGVILSLLDVTEKRRSMAVLKESKDYAESIVDTINESLVVLDSELRVRKANRSFFKAFGVDWKDCRGRPFLELGAGLWKSRELESLLGALLGRGRAFTDWEASTEIGRARTVAVSGRPLKRGLKKDRTALLIIEDVTARKQAVEIEALRKSEAQQRGFVANVSHELMTPIALIKGYAETLSKGSVSAGRDRARFSRVIELQADRLAQLVENLLDLSRLESGRKRLNREMVLLRPFALQFARTLRPAAARKRVSIRVNVPAGLELSMDKVELTQILQNLCENAIKYNRPGGRVTISARREGSRGLIAIEDTGIGIPRKDLTRIFERFHRTEGARASGARGTGLGLSIVRTIVRRHGGRVWARSSPGKGSVFFFTVPLASSLIRS